MANTAQSRRLISVALILFVSVSLPFLMDRIVEANQHPYQDTDPWYVAIWNRDFWYRLMIRAGANRKLASKRVTLIMIKPGREPRLAFGENRCTHRLFMADLLKKLKSTKAKVIVVDKFYNEPGEGDVCPDSTKELKKSVGSISEYAHVVFARNGYNRDRAYGVCLEALNLRPDEVLLAEQIEWTKHGSPGHVHEGLANFHLNNRWRMPIGWPAWGSCAEVKKRNADSRPPIELSLAAQAIVANDPTSLSDLNLNDLRDNVEQAYVELLPASAFQVLSAIDVLCEGDWHNTDALPNAALQKLSDCAEIPASPALSDKIREFVVIGEYSALDTWHTIGWAPGAFIHANYIEALLAGKYLRPVGKAVQFLINLIWLLGIQGFFLWFDKKPAFALALSLCLSGALGLGLFIFSVQNFGVFADVVPPSLLSIMINYTVLKLKPLNKEE
jgi:CHASE2 domain-containing protein